MKIHLNKSRLHVNAYGKFAFVNNLRNIFKNFNRCGVLHNRDEVKISTLLIDSEINSYHWTSEYKFYKK